nr:hypothetical protein [Tanacetum cinerariifolium]
VIGAPDPQMIADDMVAVDFQAGLRLTDGGAADAEEQVGEQRRIGRMIARRTAWTDLDQHRRHGGAGVDQQAGDRHAGHVGNRQRLAAVLDQQGCKAQPKHD